jgi:hypothetical protein
VNNRKLPADHIVVDGASSPGRRAHITEIAMARHRSRHSSYRNII